MALKCNTKCISSNIVFNDSIYKILEEYDYAAIIVKPCVDD